MPNTMVSPVVTLEDTADVYKRQLLHRPAVRGLIKVIKDNKHNFPALAALRKYVLDRFVISGGFSKNGLVAEVP